MAKSYKANTNDITRIYRVIANEITPVGIRYLKDVTDIHNRRIDDGLDFMMKFGIIGSVIKNKSPKYFVKLKENAGNRVGRSIKETNKKMEKKK